MHGLNWVAKRACAPTKWAGANWNSGVQLQKFSRPIFFALPDFDSLFHPCQQTSLDSSWDEKKRKWRCILL